jgi:hypothetical protein
LDLSIIQGPFSVAPCQTLVSRFATFSSLYTFLRGLGTAAGTAGLGAWNGLTGVAAGSGLGAVGTGAAAGLGLAAATGLGGGGDVGLNMSASSSDDDVITATLRITCASPVCCGMSVHCVL